MSSPLGGIAETVLVPATVHIVRSGEARKVEVVREKEKDSVVNKVESASTTLLPSPSLQPLATTLDRSPSHSNPFADSAMQGKRIASDFRPILSPSTGLAETMVVPATIRVLSSEEQRKMDISPPKENEHVEAKVAANLPPRFDAMEPTELHIDPFADPSVDSTPPFASLPPIAADDFARPALHPLQSPDSNTFRTVSFHSSSSITQRSPPAFPSRPPLESNPSSSSSVWSSKTQCLPAASLFSPGAEPLNLPELDRLIEGMGSKGVAEIDSKEMLGSVEKAEWDEYLRGRTENVRKGGGGWWNRLKTRWSRNTSQDYVDMETQKPSASLLAADHRSHIFPPMHLLPPNTTVTDLLRNRKVQFLSADTVLGLALDGIIGAEGSTYGIALTQVEVFRDAIQSVCIVHRCSIRN